MNIKRLFALLLVLTLLVGTAFAETEAQEEIIPTEALIGLWVCDDNDQVELRVVPGTYAPLPGDAEFPELFIEGKWKDPGDRSVHYIIQLNREKKQKGRILDFIGLNPAVSSVLKALVNSDTTPPNFFAYENALIGINGNDNNYDYTYTTEAKGVIYAYRDDDGSLALEWVDDYDPHIPGLILHRVTAEVPSVEALTDQALRPVIDRETDAQAAYALMRYAADKKLGTADADALRDALAGAVEALDDADRKSLKEGFATIHSMVSDVLVLDPKNYNEDRYVPFEAAGLREAVSSMASGNEIEKYSAARLCEVLAAVIG